MTQALQYVIYIAVIVYCLAATFGDVRRFMAGAQKGWYQFRVTSRGRDQALFGAVLGAFILFLGRGNVRSIDLILGWLAGGTTGILVALSSTHKWKRELERQGSFPLEVRRKTIEPSTLIFILIALFVLGPLLPDSLPAWLIGLSAFLACALSGLFLTSGAYTWVWGNRQERLRHELFEITVRRH